MNSSLLAVTVHVIGFATGAALCALLGFMQRRVDRLTPGNGAYSILWLTGFIWSFGSALHFGLILAGLDAAAPSVQATHVLSWSSTCLGPIVIERITALKIGPHGRGMLGFQWLSRLLSFVLLALLAGAGTHANMPLDLESFAPLSFYVALFHTSLALILYVVNRRPDMGGAQGTPTHWFAPCATSLIIIQVGATLIDINASGLPSAVQATLGLISGQWVIPWAVLIAMSLAQAHYADVVLRRTVVLLVSVVVAALASAFVLNAALGLEMVSVTIVGTIFLLSGPSLVRASRWLVDRVILQRPDYAQAAQRFTEASRRSVDQESLFFEVRQHVAATLQLEAAVTAHGQSGAAVLAAFPIGGAHCLQVLAANHARSLLHEESSLLQAIAADVSSRLESLKFESERRETEVREERLRRLLTEAELKALRAQVDPHFLFNTLNVIADLVTENPAQAEAMIERLAECFRYALSRQSRDLSTLDEELEFVRQYLDIEQVRFGPRLKVELSRGNASGAELIPSLILQPLVENAVKHGLTPKPEGGKVAVAVSREGDLLRVEVSDDGVGLSSPTDRVGVGLQNVKDRLHTLYAQAAHFSIAADRSGRGTCVTLWVPAHAT